MRVAACLTVLLLAATPASAGDPFHMPGTHTALWSSIGPEATRAVIARELALAPGEVRRADKKGREAAAYDTQPGGVIDVDTPDLGFDYARAYRQDLSRTADGWELNVRTELALGTLASGTGDLLYAAGDENLLVAWDGDRLVVCATARRNEEDVVHGLPRTQSAVLPLARLLPDDGSFHVSLVSERLIPNAESTLSFPVPKVYAVPVDSDGELDPDRRGLVISLRAQPEGDTLSTRAAWIRMDVPPPEWPNPEDEIDNPSSSTSAVATIPPIARPSRRWSTAGTEGVFFVDATVEGGVGLNEEAGIIPTAGGSVGVGGSFWSVEALARPRFLGGAALVHSKRRRFYDIGVGIAAAQWDSKARPAFIGRVGVLAGEGLKLESEVLLHPDIQAGGARIVYANPYVGRSTYVTGGVFARATTYDSTAFGGQSVAGSAGIALYMSQKVL